jgi:hypothetical protein
MVKAQGPNCAIELIPVRTGAMRPDIIALKPQQCCANMIVTHLVQQHPVRIRLRNAKRSKARLSVN